MVQMVKKASVSASFASQNKKIHLLSLVSTLAAVMDAHKSSCQAIDSALFVVSKSLKS